MNNLAEAAPHCQKEELAQFLSSCKEGDTGQERDRANGHVVLYGSSVGLAGKA